MKKKWKKKQWKSRNGTKDNIHTKPLNNSNRRKKKKRATTARTKETKKNNNDFFNSFVLGRVLFAYVSVLSLFLSHAFLVLTDPHFSTKFIWHFFFFLLFACTFTFFVSNGQINIFIEHWLCFKWLTANSGKSTAQWSVAIALRASLQCTYILLFFHFLRLVRVDCAYTISNQQTTFLHLLIFFLPSFTFFLHFLCCSLPVEPGSKLLLLFVFHLQTKSFFDE